MTGWRRASPDDAVALRDLERAANLVALAHVFPPETHPYPDRAVLDRWTATLSEPGTQVEVVEDTAGLRAFVAWDATTLRHLAVQPDAWGSGLARQAVARATAGIAAGGRTEALLWCLEANHRALGLYRHLGWRTTGRRRHAEWPPHPVERQLRIEVD